MSKALVRQYYDSINSKNWERLFSIVDNYVVHEINQGDKEIGINLFKFFFTNVDTRVEDLIIFDCDLKNLFSAQFIVHGPNSQYKAAAFFEIEDDKIKAITNYFNLKDISALNNR